MKIKLAIVFILFLLFIGFQIPSLFSPKTLLVFCNVGEGDGVFIKRGSTLFLIDAGRDSKMRQCLERYQPFWQTAITGIILTHPDADHMNGIKSVVRRYSVKWLFSNFSPNKTGDYRKIYDVLVNSGVIVKSFETNEEIDMRISNFKIQSSKNGNTNHEISIRSLWPKEEHKESEKTNLFSTISVIQIGESRFLMLADSEIETQLELLSQIKAQSYMAVKLAHHGSNKNFSLTLMRQLKPKYAVISVGENKYGHPGKKAIDAIQNLGIEMLQTDIHKDIIFECEEVCELIN